MSQQTDHRSSRICLESHDAWLDPNTQPAVKYAPVVVCKTQSPAAIAAMRQILKNRMRSATDLPCAVWKRARHPVPQRTAPQHRVPRPGALRLRNRPTTPLRSFPLSAALRSQANPSGRTMCLLLSSAAAMRTNLRASLKNTARCPWPGTRRTCAANRSTWSCTGLIMPRMPRRWGIRY